MGKWNSNDFCLISSKTNEIQRDCIDSFLLPSSQRFQNNGSNKLILNFALKIKYFPIENYWNH